MGQLLLAHLPPAELDAYLAVADLKPLTPYALQTVPELLTVLETVRAQGWCVLDQELELGLMSVAAPVYDGPEVVAAVNVSLQAQSVAARPDPDAYVASVVEAVVATAALMSEELSAGRKLGVADEPPAASTARRLGRSSTLARTPEGVQRAPT